MDFGGISKNVMVVVMNRLYTGTILRNREDESKHWRFVMNDTKEKKGIGSFTAVKDGEMRGTSGGGIGSFPRPSISTTLSCPHPNPLPTQKA